MIITVERKTEKNAIQITAESPLQIQQETLVASKDHKVIVADNPKSTSSARRINALTEKYKAMSKSDRKEFRKELKKEVKNYVKKGVSLKDNEDSVKATKEFDTIACIGYCIWHGRHCFYSIGRD